MKRLRIESDGNAPGEGGITRVFDAETGEPIRNVRSVTFHAEIHKVPTITVEIVGVNGIEVLCSGDGICQEYSSVPPSPPAPPENEMMKRGG
jgi:hypothetical protein